MSDNSRVFRAYVRQVRRQMNCPAADRRLLLDRLERTVSAYSEENPDASAEALSSALGEPGILAAQLTEELGLDGQWQKRRSRRMIAVLGILALLLSTSILLIAYITTQFRYEEVNVKIYVTDSLP